jgi:hypothetical protein
MTQFVDLHLKLAHFCMSELTLPDAARSNTVKQLDRRNRGNFECKYMLFLVQISMQMHREGKKPRFGGVFQCRSANGLTLKAEISLANRRKSARDF